jgi:hypothetical protein
MSTEKIQKVLSNQPQGLTAAEQKQARENIGIAGIPAQFNAIRKATDSTSAPRYVKVAELTPSISENYIYHYDLSLLISGSTGRGDGEANESGQFDLNITCRKNTNVYYANGSWSDFNGDADLSSVYRKIESVILMEQFKDNAPYADDLTKVEVWVKVTNNLNNHQNLSVSVLLNQGDRQYTSAYPSKYYMNGPWEIPSGTQWLTTTAPTGDSTAPNRYRLTEFPAVPMVVPSEVFLAEYGTATVAEISAARNAGKEVFTLIPGTYYPTVAYLREVTRNGANANFASVTSDGASVKTASVDSSGNWSNSTVNLATTSESSLIQKLNYGDLEPSRVNTLLIDSDDPEGYAQIKADNVTKGHLVIGPYKGLLDSGVPGVGDADTPVYIDSNGTFQSCNALTQGYRISITPGANNTRVIANTMHESVVNTCLVWDTLANTYDFDYYWGNWRCHVHLAAFSDWSQADEAIHIRLSHVYASEAAQKIKCGSYQVGNYYPYQSTNTYNITSSHWYYDGTDPYTTATNPDPYGFKFHLNSTTPTEQEPDSQAAHRFIVDTGAPYGDWLELDASVRFLVPNAAPSGNTIYLLLKGKYAYSYS